MSRFVGRVEDPNAEDVQAPACPTCGGDLMKMGSLGRLEWSRCRACGSDIRREVTKATTRALHAHA